MMMKRRELIASLGGLALPAGPAIAQSWPSKALEAAARAEGRIVSVGMPDIWANWRATWADLKRLYGLEHVDENMNSAEEIVRMERDGRAGTVDIGDVGYEYAAVARGRGVSLPHKPAVWDQIPDWAKDADGYWSLAYTGTIAFAVNRRRAATVPRSWKALFEGPYKLLIGEVGASAQANAGVLAAAIALGGSEVRLQPALAQFSALAEQRRLVTQNPTMGLLQRSDIDVFVMWDFQALAMREKLRGRSERNDYEVLIPADGSLTSGYTTIINKHAPHPNAAMLTREYIFSDAGQLNLARGHARPIRIAQLDLPDGVRQRLIDDAQYQSARAVQPAIWAWEAKKLGPVWQREVVRAVG